MHLNGVEPLVAAGRLVVDDHGREREDHGAGEADGKPRLEDPAQQ
jgi:hypothetical protein